MKHTPILAKPINLNCQVEDKNSIISSYNTAAHPVVGLSFLRFIGSMSDCRISLTLLIVLSSSTLGGMGVMLGVLVGVWSRWTPDDRLELPDGGD